MGEKNTRARAAAKATRRIQKQDRVADYNVTLNRLDAIFGNLSTSQKGTGRALARSNAKQVEAIRRLAKRTEAGHARDIGHAKDRATHLYGAGLGQAVTQQLDEANAKARGSNIATDASAIAGKQLAFGSKQVQGIMEAGVEQTRAAAEYAAAQALRYRAQDDAKYQMEQENLRLQANLQWRNWKRQQEYLRKLEEGDPSSEGMTVVAETMAGASAAMRQYLVGNPGATAPDMVTAYTKTHGALSEEEQKVLLAVARKVRDGVSMETGLTTGNASAARAAEVDAIMDSLLLLYPTLKGHRKALRASIEAQLNASYSSAAASAVNPGQGLQGQNVDMSQERQLDLFEDVPPGWAVTRGTATKGGTIRWAAPVIG